MGRKPQDEFRHPYDPLSASDPPGQIPGSSHLLAGAVGFTDAANPASKTNLNEMIFVPADAGSDDLTLTATGTADGEYTLVVGNITGSQAENVTQFKFTTRQGMSEQYSLSTTAQQTRITSVPAKVDVDPDTLNKRGGGQWVTAYIELPENSLGLAVRDISIASVKLNGVRAESDPKYGFVANPEISDRDGDRYPELAVKFDRQAVTASLSTGQRAKVTVTGLVGSVSFVGSDTIHVTD